MERIFEIGEFRESGWTPIRRELGVQAFGVNAWSGDETLIPEHDEAPSGHEELYVVTAGRATFTVGGLEVDAPAGTLVFVRDATAMRGAVSAEAGTTVLVIAGRSGGAYRPRSWELNSELLPLFDEGRHDELRQRLTAALEVYEDRGVVLYNLACAETLLGELEAALEHLQEAVELQPRLL